jgi:hypothetical protein
MGIQKADVQIPDRKTTKKPTPSVLLKIQGNFGNLIFTALTVAS